MVIPEFKSRIPAILLATFSAGIGLIVIVGWHIGSISLVAISPDFPPMQYNTALGLLLSGVGVVTSAFDKRWVYLGAFSLVLLISLITVLEYVVGVPGGIDQLFVLDIYAEGTPYPGRMSPYTAVVFLGISIAHIHCAFFDEPSPHHYLIRIVVLAPTGFIVLLAIVGYALGFDFAYRWAGSTGMAVHTAMGLLAILIGSTKLIGLPTFVQRTRGSRLSLFNLVSLSAALIIVTSIFFLNYWTERLRMEVYNELTAAEEIRLQANTLLLSAKELSAVKRAYLLTGRNSDFENFQDSRNQLLRDFRQLTMTIQPLSANMNALVNELSLELSQRLRDMELIVQSYINDGPDVATQILTQPDIAARETSIESIINRIIATEDILFFEKQAQLERLEARLQRLSNVNIFALFFALFFVVNQFSSSRLHKDVEEKEHFLATLLDSSINGMYIYDFVLNKNIMLNQGYTRITGYTLTDINSMDNFLDLFHPEELDAVLNHMSDIKNSKSGISYSIEYRFKHKDGHWLWCLSQDTVFTLDEQGNAKQMLGTFTDISELKAKQAELLESRSVLEHMGRLVEESLNEIYVFSQSTLKFLQVNRAAVINLGYSKDEFLKMTPLDIKPHFNERTFKQLLSPLTSGAEDKINFDTLHRRKNGSLYNCHIELRRGFFQDEPVFIATLLDVSELQQYVEDLKHANQELDKANLALMTSNEEMREFTDVASHDLQEPLRKLVSFSELLEKDLADDNKENIRKDISYIIDAASRMRQLVRDLLALSRTNRSELETEQVALVEIVDEALLALSKQIEETGAQVEVDSLPELKVDRRLMTQLMQNLLSNSLKFTQNGKTPKIHVTCDDSDGSQIIGVKDNGIGIEEQYFEQIFRPFRRLHGRSDYDGSGIGLSICRKAVERLGGKIWVESQLGHGAHFKFRLDQSNDHTNVD